MLYAAHHSGYYATLQCLEETTSKGHSAGLPWSINWRRDHHYQRVMCAGWYGAEISIDRIAEIRFACLELLLNEELGAVFRVRK